MTEDIGILQTHLRRAHDERESLRTRLANALRARDTAIDAMAVEQKVAADLRARLDKEHREKEEAVFRAEVAGLEQARAFRAQLGREVAARVAAEARLAHAEEVLVRLVDVICVEDRARKHLEVELRLLRAQDWGARDWA